MPPPPVDFTKALQAVAEWAKGLPDADTVAALAKHLFERSESSGVEHMLHSPAPGMRNPAFMTGTPGSVPFHESAWDPALWSATENQAHPGFGYQSYNLHTHPGKSGGLDSEMVAYLQRMEGSAWRPPVSESPVEYPWFSPPDMGVQDRIIQTQQPGGLRAAIGTGQGSFLGYRLRGADPWDPAAPAHLGAQVDALRNMSMQADQRLRATPGAVAAWQRDLARMVGSPETGLLGPGPGLLGNLGATAPLYKTAGDMVDLTQHMVNPGYEQAIQQYIKETGMATGGAV